jgi:homoserine dehydrogenase
MSKPLRIGVAGLGIVGAALVRLVHEQRPALNARTGRDIVIAGVSARDAQARSAASISQRPRSSTIRSALAASSDIDVFVELIGGADGAAHDAVRAALTRGVPVVTANKALIAARPGTRAHCRATGRRAGLRGRGRRRHSDRQDAARGLAGNSIERVYGILNGTCNYILSRMETRRLSFDACLAEAQRLGYAEADPTFDIGGFDTAHKLAILASLAFGTAIDSDAIHVEGIETITSGRSRRRRRTRLPHQAAGRRRAHGAGRRAARASDDGAEILGDRAGDGRAQRGDDRRRCARRTDAERAPARAASATASAVAADIADIARGVGRRRSGARSPRSITAERIPMQRHEGGYYVRMMVEDRPGAMAKIATRMGEQNISLEAIMQKGGRATTGVAPARVVLITHATSEMAIRGALTDGFLVERPQLIRIERE